MFNFNTKELDLSSSEAEKRQIKFGKNVLPEKKPPSKFFIFIEQLKNPLIYVLLVAALITLIVGDFTDFIIIFSAVLINTILGFIQEVKASSALTALKNYIVNTAIVIRDGKRTSIDTINLVPGDVVILSQGSKVPADGTIIDANRLFVDESILTGESVPVKKKHDDKLFLGTVISSGQAVMLVENIGAGTKIGEIAHAIQKVEGDTPLQKQLKGFSRQLLIIISILVAIVFIVGILYKFSFLEIFIISVALAVSSIPEGLIISLTIILAIGMQRILKHKGLVRKLAAAETLGGITVICADKTGTLTQGKMEVVEVVGNKADLAKQVLLANDMDDPIVISAFEWGKKNINESISKFERIDSIPFSSKERFFISLHKWSEKNNRIFVNGAPEILLQWTTLSPEEKKKISSVINDLTLKGKRLVGFARKDVPLNKKELDISDGKSKLEWVGLLAFSDPVRVGVKKALEQAVKAHIKVIVITGDYSQTSEFVLSELGINLKKNEIITGDELKDLTVDELSQKVKNIKLFARTTPDQKLAIVESLKKNNEIVAMMGDGVNDAPALHDADIGVAVGSASDVAKESADLILLNSHFSTVVMAIKEGRGMFENIRKVILYLMCDAFTEIIVVLGGIILGLPLPITAIQILWINLVSDGFPTFALTIDPKRADIMQDRPRDISERLVNKWMMILIGFVSLIAGLMAIISFVVVYKSTNDLILARSFAFLVIGIDSLVYVFSVRSLLIPFWKNHLKNKWLIFAVILGLGFQILPFSTSSLRQFFGLSNLSLNYWLIAIGLSFVMFFIIETFKFFYQLFFKPLRHTTAL